MWILKRKMICQNKFQFVGTKKKVKYCSDKISGQGEREWGVGIDTKKALPYTWEKKVQKPIDKISGQGEREWGVKDYGKIHQKER